MNHQEFPDLAWRLEEILMQVDHLPSKSYVSYEKIGSTEEAIRECIRMAMFDESEPMAADEGA